MKVNSILCEFDEGKRKIAGRKIKFFSIFDGKEEENKEKRNKEEEESKEKKELINGTKRR